MTLYFTAPNAIQDLVVDSPNSSTIRVTWSPPECPYGVISGYRVYNRSSDVVQTGVISSAGYTVRTVGSEMLGYTITGLTPYVNHTIHVQAVVRGREGSIFGNIDQELLVRTLSDIDRDFEPAPPSIDVPGPSSSQITISIRDPREINTGRVM